VAVLLANSVAVLALTGLIWFVQVVHYPLFAAVGADAWPAYHAAHTRRTTWVVAAPMAVDLVTSAALVVWRPDGVAPVVAAAGVALAAMTWAVTGLLAVPAHDRLARTWAASVAAWLVAVNWIRTAAWTAHAALVVAMLASA